MEILLMKTEHEAVHRVGDGDRNENQRSIEGEARARLVGRLLRRSGKDHRTNNDKSGEPHDINTTSLDIYRGHIRYLAIRHHVDAYLAHSSQVLWERHVHLIEALILTL